MKKKPTLDVRFKHRTDSKKSFTTRLPNLHTKFQNLKDDEYILALWAGGPEGKLFEKLVETYKSFGIDIVTIWHTKGSISSKKSVPSNIQLVIYNANIISHSGIDHIKKLAKKQSIPFVCGYTQVLGTLKAMRQSQIPVRTMDSKVAADLDKLESPTPTQAVVVSETTSKPKTTPPPEKEEPVAQSKPKPDLKVVPNDTIYLDSIMEAAQAFAGEEGDADALMRFIYPEYSRGSPRLLRIFTKMAPKSDYGLENNWLVAMLPEEGETVWIRDFEQKFDITKDLAQKIIFCAASLDLIERVEPYTDGMVRRGEATLTINWKPTDLLKKRVAKIVTSRQKSQEWRDAKKKKEVEEILVSTGKTPPTFPTPPPAPVASPTPAPQTTEKSVHPDLEYLTPENQDNVLDALRLLHGYLKDCTNATYHEITLNVETGEVEFNVTRKTKHRFTL